MINNTVLIVDATGAVKAKATFTPRKAPFVGEAAALLQPEARVAAGKVFYQDNAGAIRSLSPDGAVSDVTSFGITSPQQVLSFAVSPDASQLMASVLTLPLEVTDPSTGRPELAAQPYTIEIRVNTGNTVKVVRQQSFTPPASGQPGASGALLLSVVGWDSAGPIATLNTMLGTQTSLQGRRWYGQAARLDANGQPGSVLGGSSCWAWSALADGTTLCSDVEQTTASLRTGAGAIIHALPAGQPNAYAYLTLAPDGGNFTYAAFDCSSPTVVSAAGAVTALPSGFCLQGWMDGQTLAGTAIGNGHLAIVHLAQPNTYQDLGLGGLFVGVL